MHFALLSFIVTKTNKSLSIFSIGIEATPMLGIKWKHLFHISKDGLVFHYINLFFFLEFVW